MNFEVELKSTPQKKRSYMSMRNESMLLDFVRIVGVFSIEPVEFYFLETIVAFDYARAYVTSGVLFFK